MSTEKKQISSAYKHSQKSVQRPDVGIEAQFPNKKAPKLVLQVNGANYHRYPE